MFKKNTIFFKKHILIRDYKKKINMIKKDLVIQVFQIFVLIIYNIKKKSNTQKITKFYEQFVDFLLKKILNCDLIF